MVTTTRPGARSFGAEGSSEPTRPTGPTFTRASPSVVHAPGAGVCARIRRSSRCAGRSHRTRASSTSTLGAWLTPSAGCSTGDSAPAAIPSRVDRSSVDPATANLSSSSPLVSVGRIVSVSTPYTGPVSSPFSSRKVLAPVVSSPAAIAACTGAAPRHAGNTEKCRLIQPCGGISRTSGGISPP
ncbi:Uncharacterised protein [Mycobacteroides abscessus subsp. abscessus]|nr:Uncharacterised protein [Mycobacteroides abscessus subsp. abscessus]